MRVSRLQLMILLDYMEGHGDLDYHSCYNIEPWIELTDLLNAETTGCPRSMEKWRQFWIDIKENTKKKEIKLSHDVTSLKLTDIEQRIIEIANGPKHLKQAVKIASDDEQVEDKDCEVKEESTVCSDEEEEGISAVSEPIEVSNPVAQADTVPVPETYTDTRPTNVSPLQLTMLMDYMEGHGDLGQPFRYGRKRNNQPWAQLTDFLNADKTGCHRSMARWKKFWADLKNNAKRKAIRVGNNPHRLTELERRILKIASAPRALCDVVKIASDDEQVQDKDCDMKEEFLIEELYSDEEQQGTSTRNEQMDTFCSSSVPATAANPEAELRTYAIRTRATRLQLTTLVDFMEKHGDLSHPTRHGGARNAEPWAELTNLLNADTGGPHKSPNRWKKFWSDTKANMKRKALRVGNDPNQLSDLEMRILKIAAPPKIASDDEQVQDKDSEVKEESGADEASSDEEQDISNRSEQMDSLCSSSELSSAPALVEMPAPVVMPAPFVVPKIEVEPESETSSVISLPQSRLVFEQKLNGITEVTPAINTKVRLLKVDSDWRRKQIEKERRDYEAEREKLRLREIELKRKAKWQEMCGQLLSLMSKTVDIYLEMKF